MDPMMQNRLGRSSYSGLRGKAKINELKTNFRLLRVYFGNLGLG